MRFVSSLLGLAAVASARFVMYADEWHPSVPTSAADKAGITDLVVSFAFANDTANFNVSRVALARADFPNAKILIAVGGWGGNGDAFKEMSRTDAGISAFATEVAALCTRANADGIDLDWEYPGGNGVDYPVTSNQEHAHEIPAFPKVVKALRDALKGKLLTLAVPGRKVDMLAYTAENGPQLAENVDYINLMTYDIMNRRDHKTAHHSSLQDSLECVENYHAIGFPYEKLNVGIAYYAKYFTLKGECKAANGLGCDIADAENPAGTDAGTSGAITFEKSNMTPILSNMTMKLSTDQTCGMEKGKCPTGCCSQYGSCGTGPEFCGTGCQYAFGTGCTGPDIAGSFAAAMANPTIDEKAGGATYVDNVQKLFWTFDTPELIQRKMDEIYKAKGLGGVMAWSLGEDSNDWSRIRMMAKAVAGGSGYGSGYGTQPTTKPTYPSPTQSVAAQSVGAQSAASSATYAAAHPPVASSSAAAVAPAPAATYVPTANTNVDIQKTNEKVVSQVAPAQPSSSAAAVVDDDDDYETVCTTRRKIKKRSFRA